MIEPILISLASGLCFALRGDGSGYRKWMWLITTFALVMAVSANMWDAGMLMWVYVVCGTLPTGGMFNAIHGELPALESKWFNWIRVAAIRITDYLPVKWAYYDYGVIFGIIRNSLTLPAIIMLGKPWMILVLLQGFALYALKNVKNAVRWVEFFMGFIIAWWYLC